MKNHWSFGSLERRKILVSFYSFIYFNFMYLLIRYLLYVNWPLVMLRKVSFWYNSVYNYTSRWMIVVAYVCLHIINNMATAITITDRFRLERIRDRNLYEFRYNYMNTKHSNWCVWTENMRSTKRKCLKNVLFYWIDPQWTSKIYVKL